MKSYRDDRGVFHRTQAEAKASGFPFTMVDIPTSHAELIDFVNRLAVPVPPPEAPQWTEEEAQRMLRPTDSAEQLANAVLGDSSPYKNGDPTTPFMKSRDPRAIFTCTNCGKPNANP